MDDLEIEKLILSSLCLDENYSRQCMLHLKDEYFSDEYLTMFKLIIKHSKKYNTLPNKTVLLHGLNEIKREEDKNILKKLLSDLFKLERPSSKDWLIEQTEEFCRNKAVYNAIVKSLSIYDGTEKELQPHIIPELLADAIAISFDNSIGMDFFDDAEKRFDIYNENLSKIPFMFDILNKITNGGVTKKTLNLLMSGINCFTGDEEIEVWYEEQGTIYNDIITKINDDEFVIRKSYDETFVKKNIKLIDLYNETKETLRNDTLGYYVRNKDDILTPINDVITKNSICLEITFENGIKRKVSENHRFMSDSELELFAKDLIPEKSFIKTKTELLKVIDKKEIGEHQVYDISIKSPHWYLDQYDVIHHNCGKTLGLIDLAVNYVKQGYNVLYITLEMSEHEILKRFDANMINVSMNELNRLEKSKFISKIERLKQKNYGKFKVKEYPTDEGHSGHFKALLNDLKMKQKFVPEIILVDYLTICASANLKKSSMSNSNTYYKGVSAELRAIAQSNDLVMWSALQLQRSSMTASDVGMENIADAISIAANADFMLAIIRTEELDALGQMKLKQCKNRYGDKTKDANFVLGVDLEKQQWYDVNVSEQTLTNDSDIYIEKYSHDAKFNQAMTATGNNLKHRLTGIQ